MAKSIYINTSAKDASQALVRSETTPQPEPAPQFRLADKETVNLYLVDGTGGFDADSGSGSVTVKFGLGNKGDAPTGGSFTLTDGTDTTASIAYNATASTVQTALNALNTNTGPFGDTVTVSGTNPAFLITFDSNGSRSNLSVGSNSLTPTSGVRIAEVQAGDGSTQEKQGIYLSQSPVIYQESWSTITNGWQAQVDCSTFEARDYLAGGESASIWMEVEITDGSGNRVTRQQVQTTLHGEVIAEDALVPVSLPSYFTQTESYATFVQNRSAVTGLTGGTSTDLDFIPTASGAAATGWMVAVQLSNAVYFYQLQSGTDAESSPGVIRPDDYATTTNEKVWRLLDIIGVTHTEYQSITVTAAGNSDITISSGNEHKEIDLTSTDSYDSTPFDYTLSLKNTNRAAGNTICLHGKAPAPGDATIKVYDQSTGGTLLTTFEAQGTISGGFAYFWGKWVYDGSNWEEQAAIFLDA